MPTNTASTASTQQESALRVLKDDHRDVEELFSQFEATGERAKKTREAIVAKIIEALSIHASIEETVFYPAVRERLAERESTVLEALEEHHVVKLTLSELDAMSADDERFGAKVTVLMEMVRHHVREEEKEMFPVVRSVMSRSELAELGDSLVKARRTASKRPHPRLPDAPPANIMAAAVTLPIDAARAAGQAAVRQVRRATSR